MSGKTRTTFFSLAVIMVMVFSAISPKHAYADDDKPPAPTATEVSQEASGGTEQQASTEAPEADGTTAETPVAVDATPAPTEAAPDVGEAASTEVAQDPAATADTPATVDAAPSVDPAQDAQPTEEAAPASDASILSEVPENTEVTVLDANGETQPLATQAAADAIATSDPIWCPGSQAPTPGANGCTQSFTSFNDLLTFLSANTTYQGAGTIYVQQGAYQGNDPNNVIDFNSHNLSNISNSALTITGGWNTASGTIDANAPSTFSNTSIVIGSAANPWGGSLTINNISLNLSGVTNAQTTGLTLNTQGDILLSNVDVSEAPNNGAELTATGNVNIIDSNFQRNEHTGAIIRAGQSVNIASSTFGNPDTDTTRRQNTGLDIVSGTDTSLFAVIANNGREAGANIVSGGLVSIDSSSFNGTMEQMLDGDLNLVFNGYGLQVVTTGATSDISISNITANNNFLWGAKLNSGGDIAIANSQFNNNTTNVPVFIDDTGLFITGGQNVALAGVTANGNRLYGAQINVTGAVSITGSNFNDNRGVTTVGGVTTDYGHGLQVTTLSDISIDSTIANNNTLFGGQLNSGGLVVVRNSSFTNTSTNPTSTAIVGKGLEITSAGNTSLANVILDNNQTEGADIQAGGDVFLDSVTATNNGNDGVLVNGVCVHLNGGTYSGNGQYGLNLGSSALDLVSAPTFSNNGAGDIFQTTPVSCAPVLVSPTPAAPAPQTPVVTGFVPDTGAANSTGSANLFTSSLASAGSGNSKNISLVSFLANPEAGISFGTFIGVYTYKDTPDGLQIFALYPVNQQVALAVP